MASPECEIVSFLFPDVLTPAALRTVCDLLVDHTPITMTHHRAHESLVTVALRLDVTGTGVLSWIMAFGPFGSWPPTRQGPVLELAIRVKPKPDGLFHLLNQDPAAAHLADSQLTLSQHQMQTVFERTVRTTEDVLGGAPDFRSAAKATFSFPTDEWKDTAG